MTKKEEVVNTELGPMTLTIEYQDTPTNNKAFAFCFITGSLLFLLNRLFLIPLLDVFACLLFILGGVFFLTNPGNGKQMETSPADKAEIAKFMERFKNAHKDEEDQ